MEREALKLAEIIEHFDSNDESLPLELLKEIAATLRALAQPAQRQWIWLSDADIAEVVDTTCQYSGGYEEYLIKKAERKIRSMNT